MPADKRNEAISAKHEPMQKQTKLYFGPCGISVSGRIKIGIIKNSRYSIRKSRLFNNEFCDQIIDKASHKNSKIPTEFNLFSKKEELYKIKKGRLRMNAKVEDVEVTPAGNIQENAEKINNRKKNK